jgi:hypothetical protein
MFDCSNKCGPLRRKYRLESPQAWSSEDPPERLATTFMGSAFAGMMHQHDGGAVAALQAAQISE